jgi:hypothetical protein
VSSPCCHGGGNVAAFHRYLNYVIIIGLSCDNFHSWHRTLNSVPQKYCLSKLHAAWWWMSRCNLIW